ncbi:MAG: C69 family dipeptidase [Olsenella sp.]|jgi:dipeptidase|nr:C69 family dipeptidase [Olsenella sp.]MCI1289925.1 C69 family dipeptidase [Olsenella sp.]
MRRTQTRGALGRFKRFGQALTVTAAIVMALPTGALACTQIYMGKGVTDTGDTYVGRSEDYASRHPKAFGIQEPQTNPTFHSDESNFTWTYNGTTLRHTYVRDLPSGWDGYTDAYSEAGTNSAGVSVSATLTTNYNDKIAAVDPAGSEDQDNPSGLGEYTIPDIVLGCATTARDGVKRLGQIIDEKGNYDMNQIIIADSAETWVFMQLSGHQWCAVNLSAAKIGDVYTTDMVSVNPNMSSLKFDVNLEDPLVCLHSEKMVDVAKEAGTAKYFDDGNFDVASSYGADDGIAQMTRYAQGHAYFGSPLADGTYTTDFTAAKGWQGVTSLTDPELLFQPAGKVSLFQALRSYAARGEQTSNLNANTNSQLYAIGNNRTVETHMFQIRNAMTSDIATIQWEALSRDEFSVAVPSYSALLTKVDTTIYPEIDKWDETHTGASESKDSVDAAMDSSTDNGSLDYVLMDINTLAYNNRAKLAKNTRAYLDALQKQLIAQQTTVDSVMQKTAVGQARTDLANTLFEQASKETYNKCKALLDEMRAYLKGDQSGEFVPSDYDATTGDLKTPVAYATLLFKPEITGQPQSATYTQGDKAADLQVTASIPDQVKGSDSKLSYKWDVKFTGDTSNKAVATAGATLKAARATTDTNEGSTHSVDTSKVGTYTYTCTVTNTVNGQSVTSDPATITVKAAAAKPTTPTTPTKTDTTTTNAPTKKSAPATTTGKSGKVVSTGDTNNMMVPVAIAVAGVAIVVIAVAMRKRNRE